MNKTKKRIGMLFSIALAMILLLSNVTPLLAAPSRGPSSPTEMEHMLDSEAVIDYLSSIDFGREINVFPLENAREFACEQSIPETLLYFDSLCELEAFLNDFFATLDMLNALDMQEVQDISTADICPVPFGFSTFSTERRIETWWAPFYIFGPSIATWRHIEYTVTGTSSFTVTPRSSWITGFQPGVSWTHRVNGPSTSGIVLPGRVSISVTGTWFMGVNVFGLPVGISANDTWTRFVSVHP